VPDITNDVELRTYVLKEVQKAMKIASNRIGQQLWLNVFSRISILPETEFYERTGQFLDSIIRNPEVEVNGNSVSVVIGMDSSKMKPMMSSTGQLNQHSSYMGVDSWRGMSVSEALLSWEDYGTDNNIFPSLQQTNYWYDVMGDRGYKGNPDYKTMEKTFDEIMYKELSNIGTVIKT
jgi:hypothetical protein